MTPTAVALPDKTKHQLYRCNEAEREVVLDREAAWDYNEEGQRQRIAAWYVREASLERGEIVLGPSFEVPAGSLSLVGRVVWA